MRHHAALCKQITSVLREKSRDEVRTEQLRAVAPPLQRCCKFRRAPYAARRN
jgi:hypothetical protein